LIYKEKLKKETSKLERLKGKGFIGFIRIFQSEEIENIYKQIDIKKLRSYQNN
jgi:hypothetical protein